MTSSILQIISSVLGIFVGLGLDALLGKWVAYFTIVWEARASAKAREAYSKAMSEFKTASAPNYRLWHEVRRAWKNPKPPEETPKP